jgi:hypothetical protein
MRTPARMLAAATLIALSVMTAGVAQASQAEERGHRVLERTLARAHPTVAAPAIPAPEADAVVPAPMRPTEPSGQPTWLVVALGGLTAALALVAGLALLAARRANRRARVGQAA